MADTINAEQCAELLQCTAETVEELTRKGELPGVKFGRGWIYVKTDLLAYLAEKARQDAEERRIRDFGSEHVQADFDQWFGAKHQALPAAG